MHEAGQLSSALAGRYDVEREIGRGGMATVFLARDVRHGRPVAIKVLDPELGAVLGVERFLAEIQVTANLQHPNLLPLFDSGQTTDTGSGKGGLLYYVMPYVEGESLRARLERERQLPVDEAVRIAIAVASALDYAHERGVIHRDLKPENILLQAGEPVVADFGIALAVSKAGGARVTQTGLSLGTPQYMSPEQATGDRVVDRRADIYSLAAVTYEMLTGEPPHTGSTMQAVIARLLTEQPRPVRSIRATVPEHVEAAIDRALEKLPADRWPTAREFAEALKGHAPAGTGTRATRAAAAAGTRSWRDRVLNPLVISLAVIAIAGIAFGARMWSVARTASRPRATVRFPLTFPPDVQLTPTVAQSVSISRDGSIIAFTGLGLTGGTQVFVRSIGDPVARPVAGTVGAITPFLSPDSKWLAYIDGQYLRKVSLESGATFQLADLKGAFQGAVWTKRGEILISASNDVLWRIPENGGALRRICEAGIPGAPVERSPFVLPDGDTFLFSAHGTGGIASAKLAVGSISTGKCRLLGIDGLAPLGFVDNNLIYVTSAGVITAVPFDGQRATAPPVPLVTDIAVFSNSGTVQASLSATGTLVTQSGAVASKLVVADLSGNARALPAEPRSYGYPRLSPNGATVAITVIASAQREVWTYDISAGTSSRVTVGDFVNERPEWSADGKRVLYRTTRGGRSALWWRAADLSGPEQPLLASNIDDYFEGVITPDGRTIVYQVDNGNANLLYRAIGGSDTTSHPIAVSDATETQARVSPDGKWVAFVTTESGRDEVVVQPFPGPGARTQVSVDGGREPVWSRDGQRLFYRENQQFVAANVRTAPAFAVVSRNTLFKDRFVRGPYHANFDVMPDGAHLLLLEATEQAQLMIVHNWADEVRRRLRGGQP
jgi:serine/threonine-protein kinase